MSAAVRLEGAHGLLDELLAEQRQLSAVESFARRHEAGAMPVGARIYEERIPVGRTPGPGQQLAFRVDLDACTGCKACVAACHSLNGLAPEETWRSVGLLVGEGESGSVQQTVTTACHHCEDPGCLSGCPVRAYEKDPVTGIVRHLDDQCIGCQYCTLTCPYEVPQYSESLGIVRKCDLCAGRLAEGEAPACVQGCPNGAIAIEIVDLADRMGAGAPRALLPVANGAAPDPAITRPTTRYVSRRPVRALVPADLERIAPSRAHDPLAVMLVGMQLSVGTLLFESLGSLFGAGNPLALALAAGAAVASLGAATLHLGRPLYAFRAFLGWRTSWMSREILAFGGYVPLLALAAVAAIVAAAGGALPLPGGADELAGALLPVLRVAALALGIAGTACSAMIYAATGRPVWAVARTAPSFAATALGLGALGVAVADSVAVSLFGVDGGAVAPLLLIGLAALAAKAWAEARFVRERRNGAGDPLSRTAALLRGPLRRRLRARFALAAAGAVAVAAALALALGGVAAPAAACGLAALACWTLGEGIERHLFFTAESTPAMPGH